MRLLLSFPPRSTTKSGKAQPDGSANVPVKTTVLVQGNPVASVQLVYVIGYGQETSLDMSSEGAQHRAAAWVQPCSP